MGSTGSDVTPELPDTGTGRPSTRRDRFLEWVKVDGDRLLITVGLSAAVFGLLLLLYWAGVIAFTNENSVTRMASGMIAGTFSLVTLVVSVNQLILSQEFSPAGQHRDRMSGVMEFRRDVEELADVSTTPAEPTRIIEVLAEAIGDRANALSESVADQGDEELERRVAQYVRGVDDSVEWVDETFDGSEVDTFNALTVAIEYDDGRQLHAARRLRNDAPGLSEEAGAKLDELIETLRLFSTVQEHFKTVYLQRELTKFSQLTLYCGIPAVLSSVLIALLYGDMGGATISSTYLPYVTSLLATVVLVPLVLLAAFILRTATVTRRTAADGPMLLGETSDDDSVDVTDSPTD